MQNKKDQGSPEHKVVASNIQLAGNKKPHEKWAQNIIDQIAKAPHIYKFPALAFSGYMKSNTTRTSNY